jgi:sugar fermentation stimulation protein A
MRFQTPLIPARLIRRYKRFLADARLADGREVTAHVGNPGSMMGLAEPGARIWLEPNDDPKRKLKFAWRLVEHDGGHYTGVDPGAANRIVREALEAGRIAELAGYDTIRPEVRYGARSRVDFLLSGPGRPETFVEVKSVTLSRAPGLAEFPDAVTARGARHLAELAAVAEAGKRAVLLFLVQRTDAREVALAADIDPGYARAFAAARAAGLDVLALGTHISRDGIDAGSPLPLSIA